MGDLRAAARLISLVEAGSPELREVTAALMPHTGRAHVVGITGAPGVGKSTACSALVARLRGSGRTVGVLAVDPSSPFSGGALLGDRVRMTEHALDPGVFIRSMASRGHLGGLAWSTPQAVRVLDAAGCEVIVVETVGVGQSEVEVAALADTTLVLLAPGMGDGIQAAKAGILEIGDVYVVNKADRDGADRVARDLRSMLALADRESDHRSDHRADHGADHESDHRSGAWRRPVLRTVAATGEGMAQVTEQIDAHREWLQDSGQASARRERRARAEIEAIALAGLRERWRSMPGGARVDRLAAEVAAGSRDPYAAAEDLLASPGRMVAGGAG